MGRFRGERKERGQRPELERRANSSGGENKAYVERVITERRDEYIGRAQMNVYGKRGDSKENKEFQKLFHTKDLKRFFLLRTVGGMFLMLDENLI